MDEFRDFQEQYFEYEVVKNKTEILSDDALVWTPVFIDWLDGVELFY